jgi:ribosomal 50S subunit-associated protein YjgA (DUF615 family)
MLFATGDRMIEDGYPVEAAVSDYMKMHPDADEAKVRAEIEELASK